MLNDSDHILLVSERFTGHRLSYVRLLIDRILADGAKATLLIAPGGLSSNEFAAHLRDVSHLVRCVETDRCSVLDLSTAAQETGATMTVVPDGDRLAFEVALRGGWRGPGTLRILVMRPSGKRSRVPGIRLISSLGRLLVRTVARLRPRVRVLSLGSSVQQSGSAMVVPDPVTYAATHEQIRALRDTWPGPPGRYWFAVVGALNARKNVDLICGAVLGEFDREIGFVVAGRADESLSGLSSYLDTVAAAGVPVERIDGILSDELLDAVVGAADCVILAHSNEGPSGILGKAAVAGTRVVMSGASSLRRDARSLTQHSEWVPLDVQALHGAMFRASHLPAPPTMQLGATSFSDALIGRSV